MSSEDDAATFTDNDVSEGEAEEIEQDVEEEPAEEEVPEVCSECEDEDDDNAAEKEEEEEEDEEDGGSIITVTLTKNYSCSVCDRKMYLPCLKLCWACGEDNEFCQECVKARMFWCVHCDKYNGTNTNRKRKIAEEEEEPEEEPPA